jgi:hypothetical protein
MIEYKMKKNERNKFFVLGNLTQAEHPRSRGKLGTITRRVKLSQSRYVFAADKLR